MVIVVQSCCSFGNLVPGSFRRFTIYNDTSFLVFVNVGEPVNLLFHSISSYLLFTADQLEVVNQWCLRWIFCGHYDLDRDRIELCQILGGPGDGLIIIWLQISWIDNVRRPCLDQIERHQEDHVPLKGIQFSSPELTIETDIPEV